MSHWAAGLALASASALLRFWSLSQTPYANGWDGYFYLVQLKSLEETGRMHSPEASLIYPYLRLFYWIAGDYVAGMKAGASVLAGVFTAAVYRMARNGVQHWPLAAWSLFSPHLTYFTAQYPKNLLGIVLLLAFIGSLPGSEPDKFSKTVRPWIVPAMLLTINYFGHRLTFALAVIYLVCWFIAGFRSTFFNKAFALKSLLGAGVALVLLLAAGRVFPGLFHLMDIERLKSGLIWPPQFAPYSFITQFGAERISGWWLAEVLFVTFCWLSVAGYGLWAVGRRVLRPSKRAQPQSPIPNPQSRIPLFCICTLLLFPFLEWSFTGAAWRFFLVFVLLTPLLVIDFQFDKWRRSGLIFAVVLLCSSFFFRSAYDPQLHDPDYARFAEITARSKQILAEKKPELVIAHNALAEFFTFTTGTDAMPWLPEYAVDSNRLWRIATGVRFQTLRYYAGKDGAASITAIGYQYCVLPEHVWQSALRQAKTEKDELFLAEMNDWRNPSRSRPGWLLHRKRAY